MNFFRLAGAAAALAIGVFSCTPETVNPRHQEAGGFNDVSLQGDAVAHPTLAPVCSPYDTFELAMTTGDLTMPGTSTDCGWMKIYNGENENGEEVLAVDYTAGTEWYISEITYFFGNPSQLQIGPNGVPIVDAAWTTEPVNPVINQYQTRTGLDGLPGNNVLISRVTVGQLDWVAFDGSLDANTITELWVWNQKTNPTGNGLGSPPLFVPWTTVWCNPPVGGDTSTTDTTNNGGGNGGCNGGGGHGGNGGGGNWGNGGNGGCNNGGGGHGGNGGGGNGGGGGCGGGGNG